MGNSHISNHQKLENPEISGFARQPFTTKLGVLDSFIQVFKVRCLWCSHRHREISLVPLQEWLQRDLKVLRSLYLFALLLGNGDGYGAMEVKFCVPKTLGFI